MTAPRPADALVVIVAALTAAFAGAGDVTPMSIIDELDLDEAKVVLAVALGMLHGAIQMQADDMGITPVDYLQSLGRNAAWAREAGLG